MCDPFFTHPSRFTSVIRVEGLAARDIAAPFQFIWHSKTTNLFFSRYSIRLSNVPLGFYTRLDALIRRLEFDVGTLIIAEMFEYGF